ncbi:unnamed protein product [Soboliphyme baturini]|uniref:Nanos-type domain-containing protein n=1 Tax=Soboliphyme baturini TaxID=241478 RepID=A0A183IA66_9BILA|nr:unnamed protein product [Soboliphyme baturini]
MDTVESYKMFKFWKIQAQMNNRKDKHTAEQSNELKNYPCKPPEFNIDLEKSTRSCRETPELPVINAECQEPKMLRESSEMQQIKVGSKEREAKRRFYCVFCYNNSSWNVQQWSSHVCKAPNGTIV